MDRLTGMAVFATVVELRSFTAAARQLGLSKSTVSKQVAHLEDRLGARLLHRTTRKLSLTAAGEAYYQAAAAIIAEATGAERHVAAMQSAPRGVLRVNAPMSYGQLVIAPLLADFLAAHPEVEIDLTLDDRFVDMVAQGYDLAIRIARLADSTLVARLLAPMRTIVVASAAYLARRGTPTHPSQLSGHDCLIYTFTEQPGLMHFEDGVEQVSVRVEGRLRANNGDVLGSAAAAGAGVAVLPDFIATPLLARGAVVHVLPEWSWSAASIYAVYPHGRHLAANVRAFRDFLTQRLRPEPAGRAGR